MNIFLIITGLILLMLFSFPILLNVLNFANLLGIVFSLLLCLYGKCFGKFNTLTKTFWQKKHGKVVLSAVGIICTVTVIICGIATGFMISAFNITPPKETTVVVLGCKVNPNGPSVMLKSRLEAAYDYLTENKAAVCILSGGQGADEIVSEAQAMYDWLVKKGIDKNRLFIEDKSTSTRENLFFSKEIIEKNGLCPETTIITNEFHQYRAKKIAENLDIKSYSYSAKTPVYLFPTYYVRELFAIVYELTVR